MPGEAVPKHVAVLSVTGRDYNVESVRLKTVRPFVMKEIVLAEQKEAVRLAKKANNRTELTRFLEGIVHNMIKQANAEWQEAQGEEVDEDQIPPLPLIRLRVEFTAPEGGNFDCENPQRFSNRFVDKVANVNDVVQFHRKKAAVRKARDGTELPEESMLASLVTDNARVEKIIREFLTAQSLTILPQNAFSDAVGQFVDKDDKSAMETFVKTSLKRQVDDLANMDHVDEDNLEEGMGEIKSNLERLFTSGQVKLIKRKLRPEDWDSDLQGDWDDDPRAVIRSDEENEEESDEAPVTKPAAKGKGKAALAKKPAPSKAPAKKVTPARNGRGKKKTVDESEEEDEDVVMLDSDPESESQLFVKPAPTTRGSKKAAPAKKPAPAAKQSQLNFSQPATQARGKGKRAQEVSDDDISDDDDDDDDAFEPAPSVKPRGRR